MAERNKRKVDPTSKELSPKEIRLRERHREHDRKLYTYIGSAIGLALLLILIGAIYAYLWIPRSAFASIGDQSISSQQFWNRMRYEKNSLQGQLVQLQNLEQQFGNQGYFTSQINQAQSTLSSSFALAAQTLDNMLEEKIVLREAEKRGITVSDEEVEKALREEIANQQGLITEPQATETSVANATATSEAISATATAEAIALITTTQSVNLANPVDESVSVTDTTAVTEPVIVTDTAPISESTAVSDTTVITEAEGSAAAAISDTASLTEAVGVTATEPLSPTATPEPIPTRAIITDTLYTESQATLEANLKTISNLNLDDYRQLIKARLLREKLREVIGADVVTTEEQVKARHILLREIVPTPEAVITDTVNITPTATATALPEGFPTPRPTEAPRTMDEAMAQAKALKSRLDAGEDFATLARDYSDDPGSGANGGDLGWFGKGAMVAEFETQAFSLEPGQVSEPFTSTFGVHILQVEEKDNNKPKSEQAIQQERAQAYDTWLQTQLAAEDVKRPTNLVANLPRDLR